MAPKHDEIVKRQSGGWTVAWDANIVEPATRKAFDKVIADNARALRGVVQANTGQAAPAASRSTRGARRHARAGG